MRIYTITGTEPDNLKAAIISANFYEPVQQDIYRQYGEHYGFDIIACRVMSPQEKYVNGYYR